MSKPNYRKVVERIDKQTDEAVNLLKPIFPQLSPEIIRRVLGGDICPERLKLLIQLDARAGSIRPIKGEE